MKRLAPVALVLSLLLITTGSLRVVADSVVVTQGSRAYENVEDAADFLEEMGEKDVAANVREWLKRGKISSGDVIKGNADIGLDGDITIVPSLIDPGTAKDRSGNRTSIKNSRNRDIQNFSSIALLASTLLHEKVHAHQSWAVMWSSNFFNVLLGVGHNPMEIEAWYAQLDALDRWIEKLIDKGEYEKACSLINQKISRISDLQTSGYHTEGNYVYDNEDIKRLQGMKQRLQSYLQSGEDLDKQALGAFMQAEKEKHQFVGQAIDEFQRSALALAEGERWTVPVGQLPGGLATTASDLLESRVVNVDLVLDVTTGRMEEVLAFHALTRYDERRRLVLELSPGSSPEASLTLKGRETTLRSVLRAVDPGNAFLLALRNKDISVSGSGATGLVTATLAKAGLGLAPGIDDLFAVAEGEEKVIRYRGGPATLKLNALKVRIISFADDPALVAVDRYGIEVGYSTKAIQKLVTISPEGLSTSAGLYTQPVQEILVDVRERGCRSCNLTMREIQQAIQQENRRFTMLSNIMKVKHDTAMSAIRNLR